MLRNPIMRLFSDYLYFQLNGNKTVDDFHNRVVAAVNIFERCHESASLRSCVYAPEINSASAMSATRVITPVRLRLGVYHVFLRDWLKGEFHERADD
jgi:N-acetylgalactosamine 4-sulfate 6-O-sulfotransferase